MDFYVPYWSGSVISKYHIILNITNKYVSAVYKLPFWAADFITQSLYKANIEKFQTSVTLYFSSVFNILIRLLNIRFGCFSLWTKTVTLIPGKYVASGTNQNIWFWQMTLFIEWMTINFWWIIFDYMLSCKWYPWSEIW